MRAICIKRREAHRAGAEHHCCESGFRGKALPAEAAGRAYYWRTLPAGGADFLRQPGGNSPCMWRIHSGVCTVRQNGGKTMEIIRQKQPFSLKSLDIQGMPGEMDCGRMSSARRGCDFINVRREI